MVRGNSLQGPLTSDTNYIFGVFPKHPSFENVLGGLRELSESYYTPSYGLLQGIYTN